MTDGPGRRALSDRATRPGRPRRVDRDPAETIAVWERNSRTFATVAVLSLVVSMLFAGHEKPGPIPVLALIVCAVSVAVVIKGRLTVHRAKHAQPGQPADQPVE